MGHPLRPGRRPGRPDPRGGPLARPDRPRPGRRHRPRGDAGGDPAGPGPAERPDLAEQLHDRPADPRGPMPGGPGLGPAPRARRWSGPGAVLLATGGAGQLFREIDQPADRHRPTATPWPTARGPSCATWSSCSSTRPSSTSPARPGTCSPRPSAARGPTSATATATGSCPITTPLAELAPRDDVSRAITAQMAKTQHPNVYLDLSHLDAGLHPRPVPRHRPRSAGGSTSTSPATRSPSAPAPTT